MPEGLVYGLEGGRRTRGGRARPRDRSEIPYRGVFKLRQKPGLIPPAVSTQLRELGIELGDDKSVLQAQLSMIRAACA